jgi:enamine deaminase RidA (YjgF/YER057c/UK114 family)
VTVLRLGSGGPYEERIGYSRVVRTGPWILTAGCTSAAPAGDAYGQAVQAFRTALAAIATAGGATDDVVRTRMYVCRAEDCEAVGRAHGEVFGSVLPVATMVVVTGLISPDLLVEVEVEAYTP